MLMGVSPADEGLIEVEVRTGFGVITLYRHAPDKRILRATEKAVWRTNKQ